jgi:hypothetical protein
VLTSVKGDHGRRSRRGRRGDGPIAADKLPFEAYRGEDRYVFVSYAHEDSAEVFPELTRLHVQGFNIWYDEGIRPTSRWTEELAGAIDRCTVFLAFITPRFVASENCLNELEFALSHHRPVLSVQLQTTELPPGLELSLGSRQAILQERYEPEAYEGKLRETLDAMLRGRAA